ncbi:MAG: hypothetical protein FWB86_14165 [Treponema sp.]|nr:hypothetical protein [Treponema sp.]
MKKFHLVITISINCFFIQLIKFSFTNKKPIPAASPITLAAINYTNMVFKILIKNHFWLLLEKDNADADLGGDVFKMSMKRKYVKTAQPNSPMPAPHKVRLF